MKYFIKKAGGTFKFVAVVAMIFLLGACGKNETNSENVEPEQKIDEQEVANHTRNFDPALAGSWKLASEEHNGDKKIDLGDELCFLMDGTFYGAYGFDDLTEYVDIKKWPEKAYTDNGDLHFLEFWHEYLVSTKRMTQEDADAYIQLQAAYELSDIQEATKSKLDNAVYYEEFQDDLLTLRIKGIYQEDPLTELTIDSTLVYEKEFPVYADIYTHTSYLEASLYGNWEDNLGNRWDFTFKKDKNNLYKLLFNLKDSKGEMHKGKSLSVIWNKENCDEYVEFLFDDFNTNKYRIVAYDGNSFVLNDGTSDLILKRN